MPICLRFTFPLAVSWKRFFAPEWVLILFPIFLFPLSWRFEDHLRTLWCQNLDKFQGDRNRRKSAQRQGVLTVFSTQFTFFSNSQNPHLLLSVLMLSRGPCPRPRRLRSQKNQLFQYFWLFRRHPPWEFSRISQSSVSKIKRP